MKPFLSGKVTTFLKIYLTQNENIISEEPKVDNLFSNLFENAFNLSDIKKDEQCNEIYFLSNPIEFEQHPSINIIKMCLTRQPLALYQLKYMY